MNQAEGSGLLCVGLHETNGGEESYATECPKMNEDSSYENTEFGIAIAPSAMHSDPSNANACMDEYQHTGMMAEFQPEEEIRFGSTQHFELQSQGIVPDSEEESLSSSPETSSTSNNNYTPGGHDMIKRLRDYQSVTDEMDNGPVMLNPDFVTCDATLHPEPRLTFSSDSFKIEYDWEDDSMVVQYWKISDIICISCKWTQSVGSAQITLLAGCHEETGNSDPVRVQFCLTDLQWPTKKERIWHLASRYQEIWNNIPSDDLALEDWSIEPSLFFPKQYFSNAEDFEDVIYPEGDPDAVSISKRDVELLLPETFVNDTIIDFYVKHLSTRIEPSEKCRYHFFNSFFFRKLADLDKDQGRAPEGRAAFLRVRKWTRKINLFEKDFIFIPVNFNLHWSLIVICYPGEVETFEDGDTKISAKVPCILHMDSLKGSHSGLKDIIQSYLWEEWKERHPESASHNSDKFLNLRFVSLELPQQDNSFDCGLFLLHYVELFLMDAPSNFNPLKIDKFSSFLNDDWFIPAEASLKRSVIQKLIHGLLTEPSQSYPKLTVSCPSDHVDERHKKSENAAEEQNLQALGVCPLDKDTIICLPSQDEKNEPPLANSDNQLDLRSCAPEDVEMVEGSGCVIEDKCTHEESLLSFLDKNQKISSQVGIEVHDIMDSKCCSISDDAEVVACQEHSIQRNMNEIENKHCGASQDMHCSMIFDASEDDIGPDPGRTRGNDEDGLCDLSVGTSSATVDINKDIAEPSLEGNVVEAENGQCDLSEGTNSVTIGDTKKDVAEPSSERNIGEAEDDLCDLSEYTNSVRIGDTTRDFAEPSLRRNVDEAEDGLCDLSEDTNSGMIGDTDRDVAEHSLEKHMGEAENGRCDLSEDTNSVTVDDINKDVEHSLESNIIEVENTKLEDTLVDPITVEDPITDNTTTAMDEVNYNEQYVSSELKEENTNNVSTTENRVSSVLKEGNTCNVLAGDSTNGTDKGDCINLVSGEAIPCEDGTTCLDAEVPLLDGTCGAKNETVSSELKEGHTCSIMAGDMAGDSTNGTDEGACINCEGIPCEDDTTCLDAEMPLVDGTCSAKNETISENTTSDAKRPLPESTCEVTGEAVPCGHDTTCISAGMLPVEGSCKAKNETVLEKTASDAKRQLPDSICEENGTVVSDGKCLQKDGTNAKIERHYKRRKIVSYEVEKRQTRSSSRAPSLD